LVTINDSLHELLLLGEGQVSYQQLDSLVDAIEELHEKFRGLLLPVLLGEFGPLRREPFDQFKPLFDTIQNWPLSIPPGHKCQKLEDGQQTWSENDWKIFFNWLFAAPEMELDELDSHSLTSAIDYKLLELFRFNVLIASAVAIAQSDQR
jgi:hypothetical protein